MAAPFVLPSLLLIAVLFVSASFKLRDPSTTADAFRSLRLPDRLHSWRLPQLLPYGELVLGLALLAVPTPFYVIVTVATLLLFTVYLLVITRALTFDEPVTCGCFGRLGLGEVNRGTALRNAFLVFLAAVGLVDGAEGHSVVQRFGSFGVVQWTWLLGVAVAVVLTGLVVGGSVQRSDATRTAQGADGDLLDYERKPIPIGALHDRRTGETVPLVLLSATQPVLLVFLNLTCGSCVRTMQTLSEWAPRHRLVRTITLPAVAGVEELPNLGAAVTWMDDPGGTLARTFGISYPSAVLLGRDGLLAGGPESGAEGIQELLDEIAEQLAEAGLDEDGRLSPSQAGSPRDGQ